MRLLLMPSELTWWVWLATATSLAFGLAGHPTGFYTAIALSAAQTCWFLVKHRSLKPYPVQIRIAYTVCLVGYLLSGMSWTFWIPMLGTSALLLFGYCLLARMLSLCPWNRTRPFTMALVSRTFLAPPVPGRADHGLPVAKKSTLSTCELEARVAER
jgi:hypothetical protein